MKELVLSIIDLVIHLDVHVKEMSQSLGNWMYVILFAVVFCETGLVVTPFLPGDSLLFAVGAVVAMEGSPFSLPLMMALLLIAAILGDAVNYAIGRRMGPRVFKSESSLILNKSHLLKAQAFYEKHGGKAIFLARFVPIVRTFAPFVAGVGRMNYRKFWMFNVSGAICWVVSFLMAGYWFGNLEIVQEYFHLVIIGIVFVSVIPIAIEWYKAKREQKRSSETLV